MKTSKVSKVEMGEVKGGFSPEFAAVEGPVDGARFHVVEVCGHNPTVFVGCKPLPPSPRECIEPEA